VIIKSNQPSNMQLKLTRLPSSEETQEMYTYYCMLCEAIFALSKHKINPRKIKLILADKCPDCGFALQKVLRCEIMKTSTEIGQVTHPKIGDPNILFKPDHHDALKIGTAATLQTDSELNLTGVSQLDRTIKLQLGQFVVFHGKAAEPSSYHICVRATHPHGLDSDVIFLDGGNTFDAYAISDYAIRQQLNPEKTLARIHLSRAFTYHQLSALFNEKLSTAIRLFKARLVIISDITALYCDPDVAEQNWRETFDVFKRDIKALTTLAEKNRTLIIATNLQSRNSRMDTTLLQTALVSAKLENHSTFIQLTLARHPFTPQLKTRIFFDKQTLESYI